MTARSRGHNQTNGWHDLHNSTYDADDDGRSNVEFDHSTLYTRNIPLVLNEDGLRAAFAKYGTLTKVFLSPDPNKRYAMITYETPGEAKLAMTKLNRTEPLKLIISIAQRKPRDGGRNTDRNQNGPSRKNADTGSITSNRSTSSSCELALAGTHPLPLVDACHRCQDCFSCLCLCCCGCLCTCSLSGTEDACSNPPTADCPGHLCDTCFASSGIRYPQTL